MADKEHQRIYEALVNILGSDFISDDTSIMEAYVRDWLPPGILSPLTPEFVVLPENTKECLSLLSKLLIPFPTQTMTQPRSI